MKNRDHFASILERVRQIFTNERQFFLPEDVSHLYTDKYLLGNYLANISIALIAECFTQLGISKENLFELKRLNGQLMPISLCFESEETCQFIKKTEQQTESPSTEISIDTKIASIKIKDKTVTTSFEYSWEHCCSHSVFIKLGAEKHYQNYRKIAKFSHQLTTSSEKNPKVEKCILPSIELQINWVLDNLDDALRPNFQINRSAKYCKTPRRNQQIEEAIEFFFKSKQWSYDIKHYLHSILFENTASMKLPALHENYCSIPVIPIFEWDQSNRATILTENDTSAIVDNFQRSLRELKVLNNLSLNDFPAFIETVNLVSAIDVFLPIGQAFIDGVKYIEDLLYKQVLEAIGSEIRINEFYDFMDFHHRQKFKRSKHLIPKPFSYSLRRRSDVHPEGVVNLSIQFTSGETRLLATSPKQLANAKPVTFHLDAATKIQMACQKTVHTAILYQFGEVEAPELKLNASCNPFSCFILFFVSFKSANEFEPISGIVLKDKDNITIPLPMEQIPTAKEFQKQIESLSKEQSNFAKVIRSMQLSNTLFGFILIPLKPQLEKVLNLPSESLAKELTLCEDLISTIVNYQIPSDLLSYDGPDCALVEDKIEQVKNNTAAILSMIDSLREDQLRLEKMRIEEEKARKRREEAERFRREQLAKIEQERQRTESLFQNALRVAAETEELGMSVLNDLQCQRGTLGAKDQALEFTPQSSSRLSWFKKKITRSESPFKDSINMKTIEKNTCLQSEMSGGAVNFSTQGNIGMRDNNCRLEINDQIDEITFSDEQPAVESVDDHNENGPLENELSPDSREVENEKEGDQIEVRKSEGSQPKIDDHDFTAIPLKLENKLGAISNEIELAPTIIKIGDVWERRQSTLVGAKDVLQTLSTKDQKQESKRAMDLLDALSRSGAISLQNVSLHVLIPTTQCFGKALMSSLVQDNMDILGVIDTASTIVDSVWS